jgi:transcriptional regulator with XRE-family HTH domain
MAKLTKLRPIRERRALTQQQLAELARINRVSLARLETGQAEARPTTVRKLADALGVDPADLMEPMT